MNVSGSNPYVYVVTNRDHSNLLSTHFDETINAIFAEHGMTPELQAIKAKNPNFFAGLKDRFDKANKKAGGFGNWIAIALPKGIADELCFPTNVDNGCVPFNINGKAETRVSEITANFEQAGKHVELGLILSEELRNPWKAAEAGIEMRYFGPLLSAQSIEYAEYLRELNEVMEYVKVLYNQRMEREHAATA